MFLVTEAEATAIRAIYEQEGGLCHRLADTGRGTSPKGAPFPV
jgi:hypothetical protein